MQPLEPTLLWRVLIGAQQSGNTYISQLLRNPSLPKFVRESGLKNVRTASYFVERHSPVSANDRQLLTGVLGWLVGLAKEASLPESDIAELQQAMTRGSAADMFDSPNYHYIEGHVLVMGTV